MIRSLRLVDPIRSLALILCAVPLLKAQSPSTSEYVYNVTDPTYGATGNGTTDDSAAIQSAINAALANPGIVYFPAGTYRIGTALTGAAGAPVSMAQLTFRGSGVGSTTLLMDSGGSLTVTAPSNSFHAGTLENFTIACRNSGLAGLYMKDAIGIKVRDVLFSGCTFGVRMQDVSSLSTRNDFDEVSFATCGTAVSFENLTGTPGSLFTYNRFRVWVNGTPRIFVGNGGPSEQKGYFDVKGTAPGGTIVFDAHTPSSNLATFMVDNTYLVQLQSESTSSPSYIFDDTVDAGKTAVGNISGTAQLQYDSNFASIAPNSKSVPVSFLNKAAPWVGNITIGSGTSDTFTSAYLQTGSICYAAPIGATTGSVISATYFSNPASSGSITLNHPAMSSGVVFNVYCRQP